MKRKFLKALCLAGVLAFVMPVVGYCDNVSYEKESIVLEDNAAVNDELFYALREGDLEKVKLLLENGADVNANKRDDLFGETPLHYAVMYGDVEIVKLLIEKGADVNVINNWKGTPLYLATTNNNVEIVKELIENGANVNSKNYNGYTLLHIACKEGNVEIARLLIENGADINAKDSYGHTPLDHAYNLEIAELLVENGAMSARPMIGISSDRIHFKDMPIGVDVAFVIPSSPAQLAGIEKGDIITEFCGVAVEDVDQLNKEKTKHIAGEEVEIKVYKRATGETKVVKIKLGQHV